MQPVLCRVGCFLPKPRHGSLISSRCLSQHTRCHCPRCLIITSITQRGDNSRTAFPFVPVPIRHYSTDPPKYWDDVKNLPAHDPEKGDLVYVGPLAFMIKGVKAFSLSTSIMGLGLQPFLLYHTQGHATGTIIAVGAMMGFFILCTPLLIHFITKKYVTDLYYNPATEVFTATTYNILVRRKKWEFTPEDVSLPTVPGMFTSVLVKEKPLFMDQSMFRKKDYYIKMMGYDKPLDWEIPNPDRLQEQEGKH